MAMTKQQKKEVAFESAMKYAPSYMVELSEFTFDYIAKNKVISLYELARVMFFEGPVSKHDEIYSSVDLLIASGLVAFKKKGLVVHPDYWEEATGKHVAPESPPVEEVQPSEHKSNNGHHSRRFGASKLDEDKVRYIRWAYPLGLETHLSLAERFGVSEGTIWHVIHRRTWKNIPDAPLTSSGRKS